MIAPTTPQPPRFALRPKSADVLGVSLRSVMAWAKSGNSRGEAGRASLRFPVDGLRAWVATRTSWPTSMEPTSMEPAAIDGEHLQEGKREGRGE